MRTPANLNLEWILRIWTVAFISIALTLFVVAWLIKSVRTGFGKVRMRPAIKSPSSQ